MTAPRILVVGGNGFLGSAICKTALAKGYEVHSISSSGKPYVSPAGHTPAWSPRVHWHRASAFDPPSYSSLVASSSAVVHTLGILLEDAGYKRAIREGDLFGLAKAFMGAGEGGGRLKSREEAKMGYEGMNRDSALTVLRTMLSTPSTLSSTSSRPFIYISAADAFRPVVPSRYLETKREAENGILQLCEEERVSRGGEAVGGEGSVRPVFVRPGLMYHPHLRPLSTLPSFLLSLTAALPLPNPFASKSPLHGGIEALRTYPLHVDHVAEAVVRCIGDETRRGVVDVGMMRDWAGFGQKGGLRAEKEGVA